MPLVASFRNIATLRGIEYISLVAAILAYVLLYPFFVGGGLDLAVFTVLISIVLIAATYAVAKDRRVVLVCLAMLLPSILLMGLNLAYQEDTIAIIARALWFTLLAFVAFVLLRDIIRTKSPLPKELLWSAVALYLLFGVIWAILYSVIEINVPGSFIHGVLIGHPVGDADFIYYSFVTLATLGYGEILPVTAQARSLVILEIITGVLYLAILIALFLKRVD
jgi:hypothetical protein